MKKENVENKKTSEKQIKTLHIKKDFSIDYNREKNIEINPARLKSEHYTQEFINELDYFRHWGC
ncbi:MAG: hypothetical protein WC614_00645 [bacterium]